MKRILSLFFALLLLPFLLTINGCKKDNKETTTDPNTPVEVSFNVDNVTNGLKTDIQCLNLLASYVKVTLSGGGLTGPTVFKLDVFYIANKNLIKVF